MLQGFCTCIADKSVVWSGRKSNVEKDRKEMEDGDREIERKSVKWRDRA